MDSFRDAIDGSVFYQVGPLVTRDQDEAMLWFAAEKTRDFLLKGKGRRPQLVLSEDLEQDVKGSNAKFRRRQRALKAPKAVNLERDFSQLASRSTFFLNAERTLGLGKVGNRRSPFAVPSAPASSSLSTPGRDQGGGGEKRKGNGEQHGGNEKEGQRTEVEQDTPSLLTENPFDQLLHSLVESRARRGVDQIVHHAVLHRRASSKRFRPRSHSSVEREQEEEQNLLAMVAALNQKSRDKGSAKGVQSNTSGSSGSTISRSNSTHPRAQRSLSQSNLRSRSRSSSRRRLRESKDTNKGQEQGLDSDIVQSISLREVRKEREQRAQTRTSLSSSSSSPAPSPPPCSLSSSFPERVDPRQMFRRSRSTRNSFQRPTSTVTVGEEEGGVAVVPGTTTSSAAAVVTHRTTYSKGEVPVVVEAGKGKHNDIDANKKRKNTTHLASAFPLPIAMIAAAADVVREVDRGNSEMLEKEERDDKGDKVKQARDEANEEEHKEEQKDGKNDEGEEFEQAKEGGQDEAPQKVHVKQADEGKRRPSASTIAAAAAAEAAVQAAEVATNAASETLEQSVEVVEEDEVHGDRNADLTDKKSDLGDREKAEEAIEGVGKGSEEEGGGGGGGGGGGDLASAVAELATAKVLRPTAREPETPAASTAEAAAVAATVTTTSPRASKTKEAQSAKPDWRRRTTLDMLDGIGFDSDEESISGRSRRSSSRIGRKSDGGDSDISYGASSEEEEEG